MTDHTALATRSEVVLDTKSSVRRGQTQRSIFAGFRVPGALAFPNFTRLPLEDKRVHA